MAACSSPPTPEPAPGTLETARSWPLLQEVPRARLRGFWIYDTDPLPDAFALWMARNRFNLSAPARPGLRRRLSLHGWGGQHDQLQQEFSAPGLFDRHPEWYSVIGGVRRPVSPTGNYVNPAFGSPGAAAYFAQRMVERLAHGDLRHVDVLNVWPADDRFRPFDESPQALAIGNPSDNLLVFYGRVARHLKEAHAAGRLPRPVTLAGISYFQTMEPPGSAAAVREVDSEDYVHVFYPIDRSWGGPVADDGAGREANRRVLAAMQGWQAAAPRLARGVVDYHNVSTFGAVAVTDLRYLESNLDTFVGGSSALFATMHPLLSNPGPRRLTNLLLAELLWKPLGPAPGPRAEAAVQRFFQQRYGEAAASWRRLHETLADSVDNAAEMFGINSLDWLLNQDLIWPPSGFYREAQATQMLDRFLIGGLQPLPAAYSGRVADSARFRSLPASIALQARMEAEWQAVLAATTDPTLRTRLQADVQWFESTASRYRLMQAAVERAQRAGRGEDTSVQRAAMAREIALLERSPTTQDTVSPVDQRYFLWPHRIKAATLSGTASGGR
jgi:hypothetical protein